MKLNIGRAENKYRYEACVSQIKKAFADYKEECGCCSDRKA